jgi:P27 family predicted phage terminase small subunit
MKGNDMRKNPRAPAHFRPETAAWWRSVVADYDLEPHHLRLLQLAGEAWERGQQAREIVAREGVTFTDDRGNPRAHPAVSVEKDARIGFARLIRELDMDVEPPASIRSGPPSLASNRGHR